jgi:hypothetical protein
MPLVNFDTELDEQQVTEIVIDQRVGASDKVEVRRGGKRFLLKPDAEWAWQDLRDYVVNEIEQRTGPFPSSPEKLIGIFKSFFARWGDKAVPIARFIFEVCDGRWAGSPVTVNRFAKNSDPYFAGKIATRLAPEKIQPW